MRVSLTRSIGFRAVHRYWVPEWSAEENQRRFGPAVDPHPHDYHCAVTVTGAFDPESDTIVELGELDRVLKEEVVDRFDGKQLERDTPEFAPDAGGLQPSCEALARYLFMRIAPRVPGGARLERVRVSEGPLLYAECEDSDR
jgi:6-pyruvoyltetrahydropterin/6-carboxytetrahydropterin synthase